jgi:hypothetical protein
MSAVKKEEVIFARVSPEAKAWVKKKVATSKESGISESVVVERLVMNDKRKQQQRAKAPKLQTV